MKKLKNKKGESLIESLAAILIFTLSSILLFSMLSTAAKLNRAVKDADEAHQQQMIHAEQAISPSTSNQNKTVTISFVSNGTATPLFTFRNVNIYQMHDDALYSYALPD